MIDVVVVFQPQMILDRNTLIAGSFNFTNAAEDNNAENLLIMKRKGAEKKRCLVLKLDTGKNKCDRSV
jgi:phosphatidylserine/phosphatidylglycerophosphate/cardiolipin synthase-like enzyme